MMKIQSQLNFVQMLSADLELSSHTVTELVNLNPEV